MNRKFQDYSNIKDKPNFYIEPLNGKKSISSVLGYYVESTAKHDVDDLAQFTSANKIHIKQLATELFEQKKSQLVIYIHGYSVKPDRARNRSQEIYEFATNSFKSENSVFIGYRWPAENRQEKGDFPFVDRDKLVSAFTSLPTLLLTLLIATIVFSLTTLLLTTLSLFTAERLLSSWIAAFIITLAGSIILALGLKKLGKANKILRFFPSLITIAVSAAVTSAVFSLTHSNKNLDWLRGFISIPLFVSIAIFSIILALMLLRLSTYPRDRYRASNYGVVDLIELLRNLDKEVFELACKNSQITSEEITQVEGIDDLKIGKNRIKLSFLAHSLGCEIATQTIRVLSDVFDRKAIGEISEAEIIKNPDSKIGHIFALERLVMVAPDIPVESILSGRANFLKSSLRRCQEAYVFSSEADLALRVASTAANYVSFPTRSRFRGYKLGNITARHFFEGKQKWRYGICNLEESIVHSPSNFLELRASKIEYQKFCLLNEGKESDVADLFTYFDCTDYKDSLVTNSNNSQKKAVGIVSLAKKKKALNFFWDYIHLSFFRPKYIDVHGGYFNGQLSRQFIYGFAFLGFEGFLNNNQWDCNALHQECRDKNLQLIISPSLLKLH